MISSDVKKVIVIKTSSKEDELAIGTQIHNQLRGNTDYIENNIVLSISQSFEKGTMNENEVQLWIAKSSSSYPIIRIDSVVNAELTIMIIVNTESEMIEARDSIYNQLVGNEDYVNCSIVLNDSDDRRDINENGYMVKIFISSEAKQVHLTI